MNLAKRDQKASLQDVALLPARAALGSTMLYHGLDKLRPDRREQVIRMFESLGLRPGDFWARTTGLAEAAAGLLALAGVLTRPAALAVLVTQTVAIAKVHGPKGFPITRGGHEFNLALMAIAGALLAPGPGRFSGHAALVRRRRRLFARRRGWAQRLAHLLG